MSTRVAGYDFARSLALFGLVVVIFIPQVGAEDFDLHHFIQGQLRSFMHGEAIATFLLLAGVGLSLRTQQFRATDDAHRFAEDRKRLIRRAALLMVVGICCNLILPTNLLSSYGGYILIGALLLTVSNRCLWSLVSVCILLSFAFIFLMIASFDHVWATHRDHDHYLSKVDDIIHRLSSSGLHSLFSWLVFLLIGLWLGRQDVHFPRERRNILLGGMVLVTGCTLWVIVFRAVWLTRSFDPVVPDWGLATRFMFAMSADFLIKAGLSLVIIMGVSR